MRIPTLRRLLIGLYLLYLKALHMLHKMSNVDNPLLELRFTPETESPPTPYIVAANHKICLEIREGSSQVAWQSSVSLRMKSLVWFLFIFYSTSSSYLNLL